MTDKAISPLRQRMIEDMTIRKFAAKTQHDYLQRVKNFAAFLGRSPDTASFEDVRRYQLHLAADGAGVPTLNQSVSTLRFFFRNTLGRADIVNHTQFVHEPRKLPVVLSPEEVARFLDAAPGLKYKAALSVTYGAGLRVSEVVALKVSDIDSKRMVIRTGQGKGNKDRYVMLSPHLLKLLRAWYKVGPPTRVAVSRDEPGHPMTTRQFRRACLSTGHGRARPASARRHKSSDNLPGLTRLAAHPAAVSPSTGLLERLDSIHPPHPRHSNPHSPRRATHVPLPRFPPLEVCVRRPRCAPRHHHGAAIRKPSHEETSKYISN